VKIKLPNDLTLNLTEFLDEYNQRKLIQIGQVKFLDVDVDVLNSHKKTIKTHSQQ